MEFNSKKYFFILINDPEPFVITFFARDILGLSILFNGAKTIEN